MDQRDLIKLMQRLYPGVPRDDAYKIFGMVVHTMREALGAGESLLLPKLGTFFPVFIERSRAWKNPSTGEISTLGNKVRLRFRISRDFEVAMNERLMNAESIARMRTYSALCECEEIDNVEAESEVEEA